METRLLRDRCHGALQGLMASLMLSSATGGWANDDVMLRGNEDSLSIAISDKPIRSVLESLAKHGLVDVTSGTTLEDRVDLQADGISLQALLSRLLRQHSYVYVQEAGVDRLWVLPRVGGTPSTTWQADVDDLLAQLRLDLTDASPDVREEAVLSASDLGASVAIDLVLPSASDPDAAVREAALAVLEDLGATGFGGTNRLDQ